MSSPGVPRLVPALFDGQRLTQARLYHGWRKVEVAKAIGVTPAAVGQYELGRIHPGPAVLAALAIHLGFPPQFFETGRHLVRVAEGQVNFRRLRSTSKTDRDRLRTRLELLAEILARVEARVEFPPVAIPDIAINGESLERAERAAAELRRVWQLGSGPIDNMVRLLEAKGIIVVRPTTDTRDVDAFSTWTDTRPIVVLGSDKNDTARSRFDAAHELGHLVLHHDVEPGRQAVEQEAHRFAAAFLMPADAIGRELPRRMRWPVYFELKQRWRVALAALLYRARTLGALSPDAYQRAQAQLSQRGWRDHEPIDLGAPEAPILLYRALQLLDDKLSVQAADVATEVRLPQTVFSSLIADVIAAPRPAISV
jgi:Zn-dependent peptidase ImmA (M78 family)/DNA-binding XRE family transcriptional regulator